MNLPDIIMYGLGAAPLITAGLGAVAGRKFGPTRIVEKVVEKLNPMRCPHCNLLVIGNKELDITAHLPCIMDANERLRREAEIEAYREDKRREQEKADLIKKEAAAKRRAAEAAREEEANEKRRQARIARDKEVQAEKDRVKAEQMANAHKFFVTIKQETKKDVETYARKHFSFDEATKTYHRYRWLVMRGGKEVDRGSALSLEAAEKVARDVIELHKTSHKTFEVV